MALHIRSARTQRLTNLWLRFFPISKPDGTFVARGSVLGPNVLVGRGSRINGPTYVRGVGTLTIGAWCAIGHLSRFITSNHATGCANLQFELGRELGVEPMRPSKQGIEVGNNVWIGDCVTVLPGVRVGNGAVLAAGAVITRDVERYAVYGGNPARKIKDRFDDTVKDALDNTKWWAWSSRQLKEAAEFLHADLSSMAPSEAVEYVMQVARGISDSAS